MKNSLISVVLATYNEKENIKPMINELQKHIPKPLEIIVVDDNSPDMTWKEVSSMKDKSSKGVSIILIRRINKRGLASAYAEGIKRSKGDIVCWLDSDLSMPPAVLADMITHLKKYDIVIGSRYVKGGKDIRSPLRVITSRMINGFAGLLLGFDIKDYDSGFAAVRRNAINSVKYSADGYGEYFIEFVHKAKKKGFKVAEIPYIFRERKIGTSKTAGNIFTLLKHGYNYGMRIIATKIKNG